MGGDRADRIDKGICVAINRRDHPEFSSAIVRWLVFVHLATARRHRNARNPVLFFRPPAVAVPVLAARFDRHYRGLRYAVAIAIRHPAVVVRNDSVIAKTFLLRISQRHRPAPAGSNPVRIADRFFVDFAFAGFDYLYSGSVACLALVRQFFYCSAHLVTSCRVSAPDHRL